MRGPVSSLNAVAKRRAKCPTVPKHGEPAEEAGLTRRWFLIDGEADFETSFAGSGLEFDFAAVPVGDDAVGDDEAEAGAHADGFGGEKRLEHVRLDFLGNAGTI